MIKAMAPAFLLLALNSSALAEDWPTYQHAIARSEPAEPSPVGTDLPGGAGWIAEQVLARDEREGVDAGGHAVSVGWREREAFKWLPYRRYARRK